MKLHAGQDPENSTICGGPDLGGKNECAEALTLPSNSEGAGPTTVQPGGELPFYPMDGERPPGITIVRRGDDASDWVIRATLGTEEVVIILPLHEN